MEALAALLEPEAFAPDVKASPEWREPTKAVALNHAAKVITSGYRLVSEDEATVDRVARAMFADYHHWGTWDQADEGTRERFAGFARSAVRALREAGQP